MVIVDEKLARRFWPDQDPIGRRMYLPQDINNLLAITDKTVFFTVVGVVARHQARTISPTGNGGRRVLLPDGAGPVAAPDLRAEGRRRSGGAGQRGSRRDSQSRSASCRVFEMQTMDERTDKSLMSRRSPMLLSLGFGAVALFLSAIGIYGVLAYLVTQRQEGDRHPHRARQQRRRDLRARAARRAAADRRRLRRSARRAPFLVRRSLESQLFGVSATDPVVLVVVTGSLALVAVLACALPARRATQNRSDRRAHGVSHGTSVNRSTCAGRTIVKWRGRSSRASSIFNRSAMAITLASTIPMASYCCISSATRVQSDALRSSTATSPAAIEVTNASSACSPMRSRSR